MSNPVIRFTEGSYRRFVKATENLQSVFLLIIRLYWGWQFFIAGKGKIENIGKIVDAFTQMGIPHPALSAHLAGWTECIGGLCLLIGFASRLVSLPLIFTMCVAYATAHREALMGIFSDPDTFLSQPPFLFLLTSVIVLIFGPGRFSVDGLIKMFRRKP
jgi:putative oxidoreductase